MSSSKRVIVNTLAHNIRSLLNICMSLYSARIVLDALGESDYGIFSLVGGVISMLGFITNAMVADAPGIRDVMAQFLDFVGNSVLIGHN